MGGLFADHDYRRLYAGHIRDINWLAIGVFAVALPLIMLVISPGSSRLTGFLLGLGTSVLGVVGVAGIMALVARRQVVHVSRSGDVLTIGLLSFPWQERSFSAPVSEFGQWSIAGIGRFETASFHWRGHRYTMPLWDISHVDPEGFAELDAQLGAALARRPNADLLRKGRS